MTRPKSTEWSYLGSSYTRDAEHTDRLINELVKILNEANASIRKAREALSSRPHWPRDAKDIIGVSFNSLQNAIVSASTMASASSLPKLPTYGEFQKAHSLHRQFLTVLTRAKEVKSALVKAVFGSDATIIAAALDRAESMLEAPL